jgi:3-oxoadipate enol-lactonase
MAGDTFEVQRGGCRLRYWIDGDPAAPALLFSNSLGTTHDLWKAQVEGLSSSFRIIRYDTRGHGASDAPAGPYTIDTLGLDALAILDAAGVSRAHVCGLSLGGLTAMWLGVHAPARVGTLMLASTAARICDTDFWQNRIEQVQEAGIEPLADASMTRWFTDSFRAAHPGIVDDFRRMLVASPADGYASCCGALRDGDLRAQIGSIAAPVLVLVGLHDPVTPPSDAEAIRARIRGAQVTVLDAAHLANVEKADAFNQSVLAFMTGRGTANG